MRFYYIATFIFYFCSSLAFLYEWEWLTIVSILLYAFSVLAYMAVHFYWKMEEKQGMTFKQTLSYYFCLECFIVKEKMDYEKKSL